MRLDPYNTAYKAKPNRITLAKVSILEEKIPLAEETVLKNIDPKLTVPEDTPA